MKFDDDYLQHTRHTLDESEKIKRDVNTHFTRLHFNKVGLDPVIAEFIFNYLMVDDDLYAAVRFFHFRMESLKIGDVYDGPTWYSVSNDVALEITLDEDKRIVRFEIRD